MNIGPEILFKKRKKLIMVRMKKGALNLQIRLSRVSEIQDCIRILQSREVNSKQDKEVLLKKKSSQY